MKEVKSLSLLLIAAIFIGCGPSDRDILDKYGTYSYVDSVANRAEIGLKFADSLKSDVLSVSYSSRRLNFDSGNIVLLTERLSVLNAENVAEPLQAELLTLGDSTTGYFSTITIARETEAKYALVCFKGIDSSEYASAATPPCFFIVSLDRAKPHLLSSVPLSAGELVAADYTKGKFLRFAKPQIYSGTVDFAKSKNVELKITVSADATKALSIEFTAEKLYLYSKVAHITSMTFKGRFALTKPVDILDNKIVSKLFINMMSTEAWDFIDLTLTDACIYGTVQVIFDDSATKQQYAVLRNITAPQEIPEDILEPLKNGQP